MRVVVFALALALALSTRAPGVDAASASSCAHLGDLSHSGCDDAIRAHGAPFDMYELARSWTPGFCSTSACDTHECARGVMAPALTLHGLWPSYVNAVRVNAVGGRKGGGGDGGLCFWPQNCVKPAWYPTDEAWAYARSNVPSDEEAERAAPAWTGDGLGAHEWSKHGTCAAWLDVHGRTPGYTQRAFYDATFALAESLGTPEALRVATGSDVSLVDLQDMFGGPTKVALGCTHKCELVQAVQCFERAANGTVGIAMDCPCVGVRDSRYDNSCAHSCERVRILSPGQTKCAERDVTATVHTAIV